MSNDLSNTFKMNDYLSIKEIIDLTSKSESTVRRTLRDLKKNDSVKYSQMTTIKGKSVLYDRDMIVNLFNVDTIKNQIQAQSDSADIVTILDRVIKDQSKTIQTQSDQINYLQNELSDKTDKLEQSFVVIDKLRQDVKLLEIDKNNHKESDTLKEKRFDLIWILLVVLVVVFIVFVGIYFGD